MSTAMPILSLRFVRVALLSLMLTLCCASSIYFTDSCYNELQTSIDSGSSRCAPLRELLANSSLLTSCAGNTAAWGQFPQDRLNRQPTGVVVPALCPLCALNASEYYACTLELDTLLREIAASGSTTCSGGDNAALLLLRDQSAATCASLQPQLRVADGSMPMTVLSQCGRQTVIACPPGIYCGGDDQTPIECKAGYYCPDGNQMIECPVGHFCPTGTVSPIECRSSAACPAGATREVVYVPLVVALIILAISFIILRRIAPKGAQKHAATAPGLAGAGQVSSVEREQGTSLRFDDIFLSTNGVPRLQGVTGKIKPGSFTAIMGGSGAGKTTLMNALLGKEHINSGEVKVYITNAAGQQGVLHGKAVRNVLGFVPQVDVMLREATVKEVITNSALSRLPRHMSTHDKLARVETVLQQLALRDVQDCIIGDDTTPGITPNQRKLVNIGIELVADPKILFLDEPSTGLDASAALKVVHVIQSVAQQGLTVAAVIHQPRQEIFNMVDHLILLGTAGRVVYEGPRECAPAYFESFGFFCPPKVSFCDFMMDVVNGKYLGKGDASIAASNPGEFVTAMAAAWKTNGQTWLKGQNSNNTHRDLSEEHKAIAAGPALVIPHVQRASFFTALWLNLQRAVVQHTRGSSAMVDSFAMLLGGCIMGIVAAGGELFINIIPTTYYDTCPPGGEILCQFHRRIMIAPLAFYCAMTIGGLAVPAAVRTFGHEKEVYWREASTGASRLAYYLGKSIADIPYVAIMSLFFMSPMVIIAPWRAPMEGLYAYTFVLMIFITSLAYLLSALTDRPENAALTGVIVAVLANLFGGFVPMIGSNGAWAYTHWAQRALVALELKEGRDMTMAQYNVLVDTEWKDAAYGRDLGILLGFAFALHVAAFTTLALRRKDKQR